MKIIEILLLSTDLPATEQFYTEVLNVKVLYKNKDEVSFLIGTTKLSFGYTALQSPNYHLAIDIPNNKLHEAFDWLKHKTEILPVTATSQFSKFEAWNAESLYFYDNNGNLLELISRKDVLNNAKLDFDEAQLLYISEIGIVCENVNAQAKKLTTDYNLPYYPKQPKQDDFTVLGDEQGLIILVSPHRNWYPTNRKAEAFPLSVIFTQGSDLKHVLSL
ncbi:VOC family protein [Pedobacter hartonius]|uniref:Catechol-2,3-dioxygenase n=1 Tax=Pedobacter hartonius TaxID=425514 RepID=A0A1H4BSU9_9SPHI|nr:VOC family protein [Pedobacter hartonius]SEA51170.1 Catechol-2,3-dioxygenase [Pedobacter hartonius]